MKKELDRCKHTQEDYSSMEDITTKMQEYICDRICKHPISCDEQELDVTCGVCKMEQFVKNILQEYNVIIDFDNSNSVRLMKKYKGFIHCDECEYCAMSNKHGIEHRFCRSTHGLGYNLEPGDGCTRGKKKE